jgi:hypothetical protein
MAMACLGLVTVPPFPSLPDFNWPRFSRCIALSTLLLAAGLYFGPPDFAELFFAELVDLLEFCFVGIGASCFVRLRGPAQGDGRFANEPAVQLSARIFFDGSAR